MIAIRQALCDGCGLCIETCPEGALYLMDGLAVVDADLCRGCEACVGACPREAIFMLPLRSSQQAEPPDVPAPRPEPEVIRIQTQPVPVTWRRRVLPVLGATVAWAARELGPVMAEFLVNRLERRLAQQSRPMTGSKPRVSTRQEGGGGRRRRRHRGGRNGSA